MDLQAGLQFLSFLLASAFWAYLKANDKFIALTKEGSDILTEKQNNYIYV